MPEGIDNSQHRRKISSQESFNIAPDYSKGAKWGTGEMDWLEPTFSDIIRVAKKVKRGDNKSESELERLIKTFMRSPEVLGVDIPGYILPSRESTLSWEKARDAWILESVKK